MNRLTAYLGLAAVAVVAVLVVNNLRDIGPGPTLATKPEVAVKGRPKIGGPFTLVNQDGKTVTDADYRGRYMLLYFGYTFCPDVCPTFLGIVGEALDILGDKAEPIVPIFVSVDPERDTPAHLKEYVVNFHPTMVGLTGSMEQVYEVARQYRVYFSKVMQQGADPDGYLMDHTSITYLMGPDGKFVSHFAHGTTAETMAKRLADLLPS